MTTATVQDTDKEVQLQLRVSREEKEAFLKLCRTMDTTASREVRQFIRTFIQKNSQGRLF
jgi:hypothetical protein